MTELSDVIGVWRSACADLSALAHSLDDADWSRPTDLEGWTVHDVMAHCAALEAELAGDEPRRVVIDKEAPHIRNPRGVYTERGVVARRDDASADVVAEFDSAVERRGAALAASPPADPKALPDIRLGGIDWDWGTLLRNRVVDIWVHDQDIRRAVSRPGDDDSPAAAFVQGVLAAAIPFMLAKKAGAEPGTSIVVEVTGPVAAVYAAEVGGDGRGKPADASAVTSTARLSMTSQAFTMLAAGRGDPADHRVAVTGDEALAARFVASMAIVW